MDSSSAERRLNAIQGHLVPVVCGGTGSHTGLRANPTAGEFLCGKYTINMYGREEQ